MARRRPGAVRPRAQPGFLRALYALGRAAAGIGESEEVERIRTFLRDSDPTAAEQIEAGQGRAQG